MRVPTAVIITFCLACATLAPAQTFYTTSGADILAPGGSPFLMQGNALSGWHNPEAYMLALNRVHNRHIGSYSDMEIRIRDILGNDTDAQLFWSTYRANAVTEQDIAGMAAEGFNTIRIPINYRLLTAWGSPGVYSEEGFQKLDQLIQWCENYGLAVILDLHAAPGGQSHDAPCDPEWTYWSYDEGRGDWVESGVACLWEFNQDYYNATGRDPAFNKQRTVDLWQEIASRYADDPTILGYELINEPFLPYGVHCDDLRALLIDITTAIRAVDTNHIILAEGNFYAGTFECLLPVWDDNMALVFHKYWRPTEYAEIQQYVEAGLNNDIPVLMLESGENSNPWFYEFKELLEANNIGWCWWGYKKVDSIASAYSAPISEDYQYVIDNFRDSPIDPVQAKDGLMDIANALQNINCQWHPGFYASLLDPAFATTPQASVSHTVPGVIHCADYDIGNQGVAYADTRYKNEENWSGGPWNDGWQYRNDGVDMVTCDDTDADSIGFNVAFTDDGEWLKYTVDAGEGGEFDLTYRVATSGGRIQLLEDGSPLTGVIDVEDTGGYSTWETQAYTEPVTLSAGLHTITLQFVTGGVDINWLKFTPVPLPPAELLVNGELTGSGSAPDGWANWNDGSHDPETGTYRSPDNSWAFWWDGGVYQDITSGFSEGQTLTFGGWLYVPGSDPLSKRKSGQITVEFYNGSNLIGSGQTEQVNRRSARDTWINVANQATVPVGTTTIRIVVRCDSSGDGRFYADDIYMQ